MPLRSLMGIGGHRVFRFCKASKIVLTPGDFVPQSQCPGRHDPSTLQHLS